MLISDWSSDVCSSDLSEADARRGETARLRLTQRIAVTHSLLTAATSESALAPTPLADLRAWWDSSIAWVNHHWLQIGIAVAAGLVIYALLSLLPTFPLNRPPAAPGTFPLTPLTPPLLPTTQ